MQDGRGIPQADLVFVGKRSGDYHKEMNIKHSMECFENKLSNPTVLLNLSVLNNAKYHNAVVEKISTSVKQET